MDEEGLRETNGFFLALNQAFLVGDVGWPAITIDPKWRVHHDEFATTKVIHLGSRGPDGLTFGREEFLAFFLG